MKADFVAGLAKRMSPGRRYLVGVSGGRDSVALLHALHAGGYGRLVVCHVNHGLRGRASGEDARFVGRLAKQMGYPYSGDRVDVLRLAKQRRLSLETAAREARYACFEAAAVRFRCRRLILAHHADDQVETVLHHLFRGTGLTGLTGMSWKSERSLVPGGRPVKILRPLLEVRREEIDAYLSSHRLRWREDESNALGDTSTRNRWRHELIPILAQTLDRDPREPVHRLSEIARAEDEAMEWWLNREWETVFAKDGTSLNIAVLNHWPEALQRRALFRWLRQEAVAHLDFDTVERVRSILSPSARVAKVNVSGGRFVRRRSGRLFLEG